MPPHASAAPGVVFAGIIRTTAARPLLLQDALQSIALQDIPSLAVVVVHGDAVDFRSVRALCVDTAAADRVVVLHAAETDRRRGYPINVGLDYCLSECPGLEYVFFLDDDDVIYPFFTRMMLGGFFCSGADVVYAASNQRTVGCPAAPGYFPKPIHHLLRENFITNNSYSIRLAAVRDSGVRMAEDLEYTEDWHFLIRLLKAGLRFHALPATLSEFRLVSDGNRIEKRDPATWKATSLQIRREINAGVFPLPGAELTAMTLSPAGAGGAPNCSFTAGPISSAEMRGRLDERDRAVADLQHRLSAMENSLSWKWTAPVRRLLGWLLGAVFGK